MVDTNAAGALRAGLWSGYFQPSGTKQRTSMKFDIDLDGERFTGKGKDYDGAFTVDGLFSDETGQVRFNKRYPHDQVIVYQGRLDAGRGVITGRWQARDRDTSGTFALAPGKAKKGQWEEGREKPRSTRTDLRSIQFDGDWKLRDTLMSDKGFADQVAAIADGTDLIATRRAIMTTAVKLTRRTSPSLHAIIDRCRERLGVTREVELFAYQNPTFGAAITGTDSERIVLYFSGSLLDQFSDAELAFVVGHELGHAVYHHDEVPPYTLDSEESFAPVVAMRFYAWVRSAEITADRAGLVCCEDVRAASSAFFKLASGLVMGKHEIHADAWAEGDLSDDAWALNFSDTWFETHPFIPLRLKALGTFARSKSYAKFLGRPAEGLSDAALEAETRELLAKMEPSYLHEGGRREKEVRAFLALGALAVALADGKVVASEKRALQPLLDRTAAIDTLDEALAMDPVERTQALWRLGEILGVHLGPARKVKIIEDLVAIARADRRLTDTELEALADVTAALGVDPSVLEMAVGVPEAAMD